jgi:hypothetical protein
MLNMKYLNLYFAIDAGGQSGVSAEKPAIKMDKMTHPAPLDS